MSKTYNPNKRRKQKKHGFFARVNANAGRILKNRRRKGRKKLSA